MAPYEALYGRPCRSPACWLEVGDNKFLGPEMIQDTSSKIELIRNRIRIAQDRQNNFVDAGRRHVDFEVDGPGVGASVAHERYQAFRKERAACVAFCGTFFRYS